jgi:apolipoprotein N-acyltransferase
MVESMMARGIALLSGAALALAYPEPSWWWLAFVALVPALVVVTRAARPREAGLRAWLAGAGFFIAIAHWLIPKTGPGLVVIAALLAVTWIPWGLVAWSFLSRPQSPRAAALSVLAVPAAFVAGEFVRSWEYLGGPWGLLGASQWNGPSLPIAALGGVWAVSFVVLAVNIGIAAALSPGRVRVRIPAGGVAAVLVAGAVGYGATTSDLPIEGRVEIVGVQPGVIQSPSERFEAGLRLTAGPAGEPLDLVVWGESSVAEAPYSDARFSGRVSDAARDVGAPILVNVDARRGQAGIYKSSLLVTAEGPATLYSKVRLVPFGEYIPFRKVLGWLAIISDAAAEDRRRGDRLVVMDVSGFRFGTIVCFESAFPDLTRTLAGKGADAVIVQSATTTFQQSWAPEQHAVLAALRAVESGRPIVHATLSGVSAAFDAQGERLEWFGTGRTGRYRLTLPLTTGTTPFVRFGDWLPVSCLAFTLVWALLKRGRRVG